jgi:hypothetical protein
MRKPLSIDHCHTLLHRLGWSLGETAFRQPDGSGFWQVDGSRAPHVLLAIGNSQTKAWNIAMKIAGQIERG